MTPPPSTTRKKRTRRTRAELRQMMLDAGKEVLFEIKPTLGFEQLTYSAVFEHLLEHHDQKVTIGSVHERIWSSQRDFQLEVVASALKDPLPRAPNTAMERSAEIIAERDLSTPLGRRQALKSAVRVSSYLVTRTPSPQAVDLAHTVRFRLWALGPDHPEAEGFTEAINEIRAESTTGYTEVVHLIMDVIGLRVRADAGDPAEAVRSIALLGNAATIGIRTDVLDESRTTRALPTGPNGELEDWYPDALALWHAVRCTLELDGDDLTDDERRL